MANYNTIGGLNGGPAASGNVLAETAFGISPANTVRVLCTLPSTISNSALDGRQLVLRASILITGGTTTNYTPSIRLNSTGNTNLTTFTNDTAIITPTAFAVNSVTRLWTCTGVLAWDVTTARLNGSFCAQIDSTYTAYATLTAQLTSGVAAASNIQWLITGIFSQTSANNTAVLKCFEMDLL